MLNKKEREFRPEKLIITIEQIIVKLKEVKFFLKR